MASWRFDRVILLDDKALFPRYLSTIYFISEPVAFESHQVAICVCNPAAEEMIYSMTSPLIIECEDGS